MKVIHLPTDVGGNAWGLSRAERKIGLHSDVLYKHQSQVGYPADIQLSADKEVSRVRNLFTLAKTFFSIRKQYDIFHFNFGSSLIHFPNFFLLNQCDLPFYPEEAKLFATYNGCDARQKYPTMKRAKIAPCHNANCYNGMCNSGKVDHLRRKGIQKMAKYVRHIWALNPDLLHFLPKEKATFLPYTVSQFDRKKYPPNLKKKLKIVHAPSNREVKGSFFILKALDNLKKKYPGLFEVLLVENMPHKKATEVFEQADLVIDQILIGWYGAFAVETMLMGKPVIARIAEEDLKFIPQEMKKDLLSTVINANPNTIEEVLERCLLEREQLREKSEASLEFAMKWHHPEYVASITKEYYETL